MRVSGFLKTASTVVLFATAAGAHPEPAFAQSSPDAAASTEADIENAFVTNVDWLGSLLRNHANDDLSATLYAPDIMAQTKLIQSLLEQRRVFTGHTEQPEIIADGIFGRKTARALLDYALDKELYGFFFYVPVENGPPLEDNNVFEVSKLMMRVSPQDYISVGSIMAASYQYDVCIARDDRLYSNDLLTEEAYQVQSDPFFALKTVPSACNDILKTLNPKDPIVQKNIEHLKIRTLWDRLNAMPEDFQRWCDVVKESAINAENSDMTAFKSDCLALRL